MTEIRNEYFRQGRVVFDLMVLKPPCFRGNSYAKTRKIATETRNASMTEIRNEYFRQGRVVFD
jgi:hypothetical protein